MLNQVNSLVENLKEKLAHDQNRAEVKRDDEGDLMKNIRSLQNFVFAVDIKEHKRAMVKYRSLAELERRFERLDAQWVDYKFFVWNKFRYPDD